MDESVTRGVFITFEGGDGVGKSSHVTLLADKLTSCGREVVRLREPGGTRVGERLRSLVLDPEFSEITPEAELFMYEAARAQLVAEVIAPAIERGAVVLCDRFSDSTIAYQGYGRQLCIDFISSANSFACKGLIPDRTLLLTCNKQSCSERDCFSEDAAFDRLEQAGDSFRRKVDAGFLQIAKTEPLRVFVIPTDKTKEEVHKTICQALQDLVPELSVC